jgi:hypothetical protein
VPLERLFDSHDVSRGASIKNQEEEVMDCNIGTAENPKIVKLSKALPPEDKYMYVSLMKFFYDIFAWSYEDLNTFDTDIIQHKIPLMACSNPFRQKIMKFNPMLVSIIEKDLKKMLRARIIVPLRYLDWVANLILVRKRVGKYSCVLISKISTSGL